MRPARASKSSSSAGRARASGGGEAARGTPTARRDQHHSRRPCAARSGRPFGPPALRHPRRSPWRPLAKDPALRPQQPPPRALDLLHTLAQHVCALRHPERAYVGARGRTDPVRARGLPVRARGPVRAREFPCAHGNSPCAHGVRFARLNLQAEHAAQRVAPEPERREIRPALRPREFDIVDRASRAERMPTRDPTRGHHFQALTSKVRAISLPRRRRHG